MRHYILTILAIIISVSAVRAQDSFLGKWVLDIDKTIETMNSEQYMKFNNLPNDARTRAKESMRNREFVFEDDGIIIVNWKFKDSPRKSTGTWHRDENILVLDIDGGTYNYQIEMLDENTLILHSDEQSGYFNSLYFTK